MEPEKQHPRIVLAREALYIKINQWLRELRNFLAIGRPR